MSKIICYCKNVNEDEIKDAIARGASSLEEIKEKTGACTGNECKTKNPSGKCCSTDITGLLWENKNTNESGCACCGM